MDPFNDQSFSERPPTAVCCQCGHGSAVAGAVESSPEGHPDGGRFIPTKGAGCSHCGHEFCGGCGGQGGGVVSINIC